MVAWLTRKADALGRTINGSDSVGAEKEGTGGTATPAVEAVDVQDVKEEL